MAEGKENKIDLKGETCPVPLVETRKAIRKASPGEIIKIIGDHPASKKEIPMAVEEMDLELQEVTEENDVWEIKIKISEKGEEKDE